MPLIKVRVIKEAADDQQADRRDGLDRGREHAQRHLVRRLGGGKRGWGIGGNALSTADVRALARGKAA